LGFRKRGWKKTDKEKFNESNSKKKKESFLLGGELRTSPNFKKEGKRGKEKSLTLNAKRNEKT